MGMPARLCDVKVGVVEKAFLAAFVLYVIVRVAAPASGFGLLLAVVMCILALAAAVRLARRQMKKVLWGLRNRLIVAYLFIAVVPVSLILVLAVFCGYWITGQVASYLVNLELNRRTAALMRPAQALARIGGANRAEVAQRFAGLLRGSFPQLDVLVSGDPEFRYPQDSTLTAPPAGWRDANGIVAKERVAYSWAHTRSGDVEVTLAAPLTHDFLSTLVPGLGNVELFNIRGSMLEMDEIKGRSADYVPAPFINGLDAVITGYYPITVSIWNRPAETARVVLVIETRASAVFGLVFGHNIIGYFEWGQIIWWVFLIMSGLFLAMELAALVIGVRMTRTITGAVHELHRGTQRVMQGDFSHRIPATGSDQLAELGLSFNSMTSNLERLIVVAKEKERLQSELEIAREVQNQLFPKNVPELKTLRVMGVCNAARMVSGDYYDFMCLKDTTLALAIGDVAGKGISAALLMAAIQSTMRTQLATGLTAAAAAGNGGPRAVPSTARLVSLLNRQLYANTSPEKYATFYFGIYDELNSTLTYTNAGHLAPILVRGGEVQMLEVTGTVVGAFPFSEYEEKTIQLMGGDLLVGYTDGIVEPENVYGEMFGEERLSDLLVKHAGAELPEIVARVMEAVAQWTGAGELQDDMTMLVTRKL